MKSASGSPAKSGFFKDITTQGFWRKTGVICLIAAGIMAWYGGATLDRKQDWVWLLGYWGVFTAFLLTAMYAVLVDVRFIKLSYKMGARDIFQETIGDPEFRKALQAALEEERRNPSAPVPVQPGAHRPPPPTIPTED